MLMFKIINVQYEIRPYRWEKILKINKRTCTTIPYFRVHYIIRQGRVKLCKSKLTSVSHHFPRVIPKQFCASAHLGCTHEAGAS